MLEDELKKSRNKLIQIIVSKNKDKLRTKIESRLKKDHNFSYNQVDESFIALAVDNEENILGLIRNEVETNDKLNFDPMLNDGLKRLLHDLLLHCVEKEKPPALKKILSWLQYDIASIRKVRFMIESWDFEKDFTTDTLSPKWDGLTGNCPALIRACEKDNFQMVSHFQGVRIQLEHRSVSFRIDDSQFKPCEQDEEKRYKNRRKCSNFFNFHLVAGNYHENSTDLLHHYKAFNSVSKSSFLIATFKTKEDESPLYDPLSEAYHNLHISRVQALRNVEYKNKFNVVKNYSKDFIIRMLNCCKDLEEARLVIQHDFKVNHYFNDALIRNMTYPRLEIAELENHEEFVGHDFCQQILREQWLKSDVIGKSIQWNSTSVKDKILYCLSCVLLMPFHIFAYILTLFCGGYEPYKHRNNQEKCCFFVNYAKQTWLHLSYPINRFIADTFTHILFLIFLVVASENPNDDPQELDIDWYQVAVPLMALGFLVTELREFSRRFDGKNFRFWNVFEIVCYLILIGSDWVKIIGFMMECKEDEKTQDPRLWFGCKKDIPHKYGKKSAVAVGYSMFGVGLTLCFSKLIYFCQIFHTIGPIAISIKRITKDIFLVAVCFLIFLQSFGLGIFYLMKDVKDADSDCKHSLHHTSDVYKSLFWNIFDPATIEDFGCSRIQEFLPRYIAMLLFGMFLLVNFIILMNALIAIMNVTLSVLNKDKMLLWKFERTSIWLRYLDSGCVLPSPFNILELTVRLLRYPIRRCQQADVSSNANELDQKKR